MRAVRAIPSATNLTWAVDTLATVTRESAITLVSRGCVVRLGYVDHVTPEEFADQVSVGLGFMPVTYAGEYDGAHAVARLRALGVPPGVTAWVDVEGQGLEANDTILRVNAWAATVQAAGYEAGMYVGAGCPLTPGQLSNLAVTRYWHSCSRALSPDRGYCMRQLRPDDVYVGGVRVDVDIIEPDYRGDLPTVCVA